MNQLSPSVVIFIAGNVFMNGYSNLEKLWFAQYAKVEYRKINLSQFSQRGRMRILVRRLLVIISPIVQEVRDLLHSQTKISTTVARLAWEVLTGCSEIRTEGS
jgi:hypothetical protein